LDVVDVSKLSFVVYINLCTYMCVYKSMDVPIGHAGKGDYEDLMQEVLDARLSASPVFKQNGNSIDHRIAASTPRAAYPAHLKLQMLVADRADEPA
jgi:hypothetical protein